MRWTTPLVQFERNQVVNFRMYKQSMSWHCSSHPQEMSDNSFFKNSHWWKASHIWYLCLRPHSSVPDGLIGPILAVWWGNWCEFASPSSSLGEGSTHRILRTVAWSGNPRNNVYEYDQTYGPSRLTSEENARQLFEDRLAFWNVYSWKRECIHFLKWTS